MDVAIVKGRMQKSIDYLTKEFQGLSVGRASKGLVENIMVDAGYGPMPVGQMANITTPDAQSIKIEPWDKSVVKAMEAAIYDANTGLTPRNDGDYLMITIPPLTTERRAEIAKQVKQLGEETKKRLRQVRQDERDKLKKALDEKEISEDQKKGDENKIDDVSKEFNNKVDELVKIKTDEVMKV